MNKPKTITCIIGTRPEAIKMAPVIHALQATSWARCVVIASAQHRGLLDQMLLRLSIKADHDLDLMTPAQTPSQLLARMLPALETLLVREQADVVLAQGDTTTVLAAALAAFHQRIPFGHVEAGLRTYNLEQPFPEEGYRQMASRITRWHFAPTEGAAHNLQAEGISSAHLYITGNTGIDTLLNTVSRLGQIPSYLPRTILVTAHRRENFGQPLQNIYLALIELAETYPDTQILYPVHPNPNVSNTANALLGDTTNIRLLPPLDYFAFVELMRRATLILTDSGGVQEEAPALGKPVLVLREETERPEAIEAGVAMLVGTQKEAIVKAATRLLDDADAYAVMAKGASPYGDGRAAVRIVEVLSH